METQASLTLCMALPPKLTTSHWVERWVGGLGGWVDGGEDGWVGG